MTGANYTGGKRNVARTRFRDSTRRVQKNHFGRRRLGILSRGLVNGKHSRTEEEPAPGISDILLEHAQRDISLSFLSSPARQKRTVAEVSFDRPLAAGSSSICSNVIPSNSRVTHILDNGSYSSLRAEVDRILEFSRTIGLCNYAASSKRGVSASLASRLDSDSEPGRSSSHQERNENLMFPMSESSGRQHTRAPIGHIARVHENLQIPQTRTHINLLRETASPPSEYPDYCVSQSPAQSINTVEPHLDQDEEFLRLSEGNPYLTDPLPPSFDALEFPTSPLPPSSPLPSSTTYGSLLSLCPTSHEAEVTILGSDTIPLATMVNGSCEVGSSRYGGSRLITPDLASLSPSWYPPYSGLANNFPTPLASSSKADLITDLLTCNNPWNVIGDLLDLPPIPPADAAYFSNIRSLDTLSHECASSLASSGLEQVDTRELLSPARDEGTRLRAAHSDGDLPFRPDSSQLRFSLEAPRRASSPLLSRGLPATGVLFPTRPFRSSPETRPLSDAEPCLLSPSERESVIISVPSEPPQSMLVPQRLLVSPRLPDGNPGMGLESSPGPVERHLSPPRMLMPSRSASPASQNPNLLDPSVSRSPGVESTLCGVMTGFDLVALISKVPPTQTTASRGQLPRLECPDLFLDEDDSLMGIF